MEGFSNEQGYPSSAHQDSRATVQRAIDAQVAASLGRRRGEPFTRSSWILNACRLELRHFAAAKRQRERREGGTGSDARHRPNRTRVCLGRRDCPGIGRCLDGKTGLPWCITPW